MKEHKLVTENLRGGYADKEIFDKLNISIPNGKISVIIGSNGSGKSTLLKTITRLIKPLSGDIKLDEKSIYKYKSKEYAQVLGLLPQSPLVPEAISVSDLIMRGRFPYRKFMKSASSKDYQAVENAMKDMGISDLADRNVYQLSGGQRQRVWIALALAQETDILFLDEPTTYLDIAYQVEILDLLKDFNRRKHTSIVMVLHDINLSARYADYIFALKNGKLISQGDPKTIITADLIEEVFGLKSQIIKDPITGSPLIVPIGKYDLANDR